MDNFILAFDQSTQGTKAMLFDHSGRIIDRVDLPHKQIISKEGWISHNPTEIYHNILQTAKMLIVKTQIDSSQIIGIGISNQRETSVSWNRTTGVPFCNAIVWQCSRAEKLCARVAESGIGDWIKSHTGIPISPYFPAAKYAWMIQNVPGVHEAMEQKNLCLGTIDSWLIYCLTGGKSFMTDYSNASRTQLFDIFSLTWDSKICGEFGINMHALPKVCDSNSEFGYTDLEGLLPKKVPICGVLGDSHGALFGQGCIHPGMVKTTYGTGSSIMMNIGDKPIYSTHGLVTSLAWGLNGKVTYCLEGNLNYTGAVITWLKEDMKLIQSADETEKLSYQAIQNDFLYLVPAFSGLGAPYWDSNAKAGLVGMSRTTGRKEIIRASLECIAYQIRDVVDAMKQDIQSQENCEMELRVDGGPTRNHYLMQFQSDILNCKVNTPQAEELSGIGAAWIAGLTLKLYDEHIFTILKRKQYDPIMAKSVREVKYAGWKRAVNSILTYK